MSEAGPSRALRLVGRFAALVLGGVLVFAAAAKALDPQAFAEQIHAEGLDGFASATSVALLALALETGLGLALMLGLRRLWVLLPAGALVAFFVFLTARAYWRSTHGGVVGASCGCFGNLVERSPAEALWTDLLLLVPPLLLAFVGRGAEREGGRGVAWRAGVAAAGAVLVAGFAWRAPGLPLDDLATRLKPGVQASALCAGTGADRVCLGSVLPEGDSGRQLVVLADLDAGFAAAIDRLNAYVQAGHGPTLSVLTAASPEDERKFYWRFGPTFKIATAPPGLLRPLYRRLPRSFLLEGGVVRQTWSGLPPLDRLAQAGPGMAPGLQTTP
ncbi:MAG: MauE/DoxX family redox-associated membrane protein [Acidobacteriota bacterium]